MKQPPKALASLLLEAGFEPGQSRQIQCACGAWGRVAWRQRSVPGSHSSMRGYGTGRAWRFEDTVTLGGAVTYGRVDGKAALVCRRCGRQIPPEWTEGPKPERKAER